jgi:alkylation response protein AidB-like acyl-CoA dehydrogenase
LGVVGALSRAFAIARSYATVRTINVPNTNGTSDQRTGTHVLLQDVPLHTSTLARIGVTYQALANFVFSVVALLGKSECGVASESEEQRLRVLTPVLKGFVSERGVPALEECMNCLGGQGYMEENAIPG